jgi:UDP-3-O-[3-hydroxymyristoyl] glucosamine N-acyltransferase
MKFEHPVTQEELLKLVPVKITGDRSLSATGINEIHMVEEGDITFVDHEKYYEKALGSRATFVIINKDVEPPKGKTLLVCEEPFDVYVSLVKHFRPFKASDRMISETARIGKNCAIQPGVFIGNNVVIGDNVVLHPGVVIYDHCEIGDDVIIHANTVIGADAFYFKRKPDGYSKMESCGRVIIGDRVEIGAGCTIDKGVSGDTVIGNGTKFDNHVHIGHDSVIGENCLFAAKVGVAGVVTIEDDVILWGQVGVQKDLVIRKGAVVLAQSGISKSLEGNTTYFGSPASEARVKMKELAALRQLPQKFVELKQQ